MVLYFSIRSPAGKVYRNGAVTLACNGQSTTRNRASVNNPKSVPKPAQRGVVILSDARDILRKRCHNIVWGFQCAKTNSSVNSARSTRLVGLAHLCCYIWEWTPIKYARNVAFHKIKNTAGCPARLTAAGFASWG